MNYSLLNSEEFRKFKKREEALPSSSSGGGGGADLGTADYIGYGIQAAGALMNEANAEKQRKFDEQVRQDQLRQANRSFMMAQRARMDQQRQLAEENRMANRSQNQRGLEYMTGLVDNNAASARRRVPSFRDLMLGGK